ncbi:MAG: dynamin-like GTPase mgm1 [Trizodia sp. TS-e1964]|nr:MAG: dynamin-like GTPase mgm1 [Trizodia sp. TS-e1964]
MSGRLLSSRLAPLARRIQPQIFPRISHYSTTIGGGLLRSDARSRVGGRSPWPSGSYYVHNLPAVRNISFIRAFPNLFLKLIRLPALLFGVVAVGITFVQHQANLAGNYALDLYKRATDSVVGGAKNIVEQTRKGWESKVDGIKPPLWLKNILEKKQGQSGGGSGPGDSPKKSSSGLAAVGATATAYGYSKSTEDDQKMAQEEAREDQMMLLTKKMIEIRSLLLSVGQSESLTLPSIVVIGSQSSGKSSVLEAIVGHEFLPKGSNMVTRRPIELTLVNTPEGTTEYGEFPTLGLGKLTDFSKIQKLLTDFNLSVSASECVSTEPIRLSIYSPNVPDLSLIDLPGYIQVVGRDQPSELKQKISELCDKYIQAPNVILAISAADVDLANSTALRASRRVDPRGERTIGVITKMDLVEAERGASILGDLKYPLRLGYVGVVCRVPHSGLFSRGTGNMANAIMKNEKSYFSAHPKEFGPESPHTVGTGNLRKKLMHVLEQTMAASLGGITDIIHQELDEATYDFKVQYNDRPLSAESYLVESLDGFKRSFKDFTEKFGRPEVRELLKEEINQRVLDLLAQRYWNKPITDLVPPQKDLERLEDLPKADPESLLWHRKLDASASSLTKLGIGRLATTVVANALQSHIDHLIEKSSFSTHPFACKAIKDAASGILNDRFYSTSDQVENCIKPYKFEIEVEDREWSLGRENIAKVLKEELRACEAAVKETEKRVGGKRQMQDVMDFIDSVRKGELTVEQDGIRGGGGFSADLLKIGREGVFLRDRADIIKMRLLAVKSKQCSSKKNKYFCPEVFLDVVADKLTSTAVLFLNVELLSEFYYSFPRELDARLRSLSATELDTFAREDPKVRGHLEVIRRKELLELVLEKMESLRQLEAREKKFDSASSQPAEPKSKDKGRSFF